MEPAAAAARSPESPALPRGGGVRRAACGRDQASSPVLPRDRRGGHRDSPARRRENENGGRCGRPPWSWRYGRCGATRASARGLAGADGARLGHRRGGGVAALRRRPRLGRLVGAPLAGGRAEARPRRTATDARCARPGRPRAAPGSRGTRWRTAAPSAAPRRSSRRTRCRRRRCPSSRRWMASSIWRRVSDSISMSAKSMPRTKSSMLCSSASFTCATSAGRTSRSERSLVRISACRSTSMRFRTS